MTSKIPEINELSHPEILNIISSYKEGQFSFDGAACKIFMYVADLIDPDCKGFSEEILTEIRKKAEEILNS